MIVPSSLLFWITLIKLGYSACPDSFRRHDNTCYHFSHDRETWISAMDVCEKLYDAHLVEIETEKENNYLSNLSKQTYWIAGSDLQTEGEWKWATSKDSVQYSNWSPNEPNNHGGGGIENCIEIYPSGLWNDDSCSDLQQYICEKTDEQAEIIG